MRLVDPSDPDLVAIEERVNGEMCVVRPVISNAHGCNLVMNMVHAAAQDICPTRHLHFKVSQHKVSRMAAVECYEATDEELMQPRDFGLGFPQQPSRENPYQSEASMQFYKDVSRQILQAKLDAYLGRRPLWLDPQCPTSRVTRNESLLGEVCSQQPRTLTLTCRNHRA